MNEATRIFPFLNRIEPEALRHSGVRRMVMAAGTPAFTEGEACQHVAFVLEGAIRVYKTAPDGRQLTLYHVGPGDSCVLMLSSVLADTGYPAQAAAAVPCHVILLPVVEFLSWLERYDDVRRFVYESMAARLAAVMLLVDEIVFRRMDERLAALLLQRTSEAAIAMNTTHEQLAQELGTVREVVSRILKSFEAAGAVTLHRGRIDVVDRDRLERTRD